MSVSVIVVCGRCSSCQQTQMLFRMPAFPTKKEKKVSSKYNYPIPPYEHTVHCCSTPCSSSIWIQQCSSKYKYKMHAVSTKKSNINSNVNNLFIGCLQFPQKIRHLHLFLYSLLAAARPIQMLFKMPAFYTKKNRKRVILKYIYVNPPSMRPLCVSR